MYSYMNSENKSFISSNSIHHPSMSANIYLSSQNEIKNLEKEFEQHLQQTKKNTKIINKKSNTTITTISK